MNVCFCFCVSAGVLHIWPGVSALTSSTCALCCSFNFLAWHPTATRDNQINDAAHVDDVYDLCVTLKVNIWCVLYESVAENTEQRPESCTHETLHPSTQFVLIRGWAGRRLREYSRLLIPQQHVPAPPGGSWGVPRPDQVYNPSSRFWVCPVNLQREATGRRPDQNTWTTWN